MTLKEWLAHYGVTQKDLANKLKVSQPRISKVVDQNGGGKKIVSMILSVTGSEVDLSVVDTRGRPKKQIEGISFDRYLKTYKTWYNTKRMLMDKRSVSYESFKSKGLTWPQKWIRFKGFVEDMGYITDGATGLRRIDESKDYSKENCGYFSSKWRIVE